MTFEESTKRSGSIQQPPPDEARMLAPMSVVAPQTALAIRLCNAHYREKQRREICFGSVKGPIKVLVQVSSIGLHNQWLILARKLYDLEITNAERFMHAQFLSGAPGFPNQMARTASLEKFETYNNQALAFLDQDWKSQSAMFEGGILETAGRYPHFTDHELWTFVLDSAGLALSPLFCYCIAASERLDETTLQYQDAALCQLLTDPLGYASAWRDCIPLTLLSEVSAITTIPL